MKIYRKKLENLLCIMLLKFKQSSDYSIVAKRHRKNLFKTVGQWLDREKYEGMWKSNS